MFCNVRFTTGIRLIELRYWVVRWCVKYLQTDFTILSNLFDRSWRKQKKKKTKKSKKLFTPIERSIARCSPASLRSTFSLVLWPIRRRICFSARLSPGCEAATPDNTSRRPIVREALQGRWRRRENFHSCLRNRRPLCRTNLRRRGNVEINKNNWEKNL